MTSPDLREFLPHPNQGLKQSQVFIKLWPTDEVTSIEEAMKYLRDRAPRPVVLSPLPREGHLTVVVRGSQIPRIEFGRSVPSGNWQADFEEIANILKAHGVSVQAAEPI
jgi:hypothetical protein